ncbi:MAG: ribbon-helix-helix protein, CopG family [Cryobacterium sp.]|nr:ribbon-helix-helix protein, CopG family [Cryobacterium sp.]
MQRTQIYLEEQQHRALARLARQSGETASALIRFAIDEYLANRLSAAEKLDRLRALGARFSAQTGVLGSDSAVVVEDLRRSDALRLDSLK